MKILMMGAGAIGAYYGARLQQAGEDVIFCARGAHLQALQSEGLNVASPLGDFHLPVRAIAEPSQDGPYDLIVFCVKSNDTEAAIAQCQGCLAADGMVLTIQNGVENEGRLIASFGDAVLSGNARIGAELSAPGHVRHSAAGYIEFGELDGTLSARAQKLADIMGRAGILGALSDRIRDLRWEKLMWNATFNTICALARCTVGRVLDDPRGLELARQMLEEVRMVAGAEGARLGPERTDAVLAFTRKHFHANRPSTLQDLERGRRMEVEALIGVVVRLARLHHLPVPASQTIYALLSLADPLPA
jgi:2-dehydropantoate 2-reductase